MSPKVREIIDSLAQMDAEEVREVRILLQEKFGFGGPDEMGVREPRTPIDPSLMGVQRN